MKRSASTIAFLATLLLLFLYVSKNNGGGDLRPYIAVNEIVHEVKKSKQLNFSNKFLRGIDGVNFHGVYYLSEGKKLVIVIEKPELAIWIFDNIKDGGSCYLAYGKGAVAKFAGLKERLCTNI